MINQIDLPPPPLSTSGIADELYDAKVSAFCFDGKIYRGKLEILNAAEKRLLLIDEKGDEKQETDIGFNELRYLAFTKRHKSPAGAHPVVGRGPDVEMPNAVQEFTIILNDDSVLEGETKGSYLDQIGLHLFQVADYTSVLRLFIPWDGVKRYQLGPKLGNSLIKSHLVKKHDVDAALKKQEQLRGNKIGSYLKNITSLTADQLKSVLDKQEKYLDDDKHALYYKNIGEMLVDEKMVTPEQLDAALELQRAERSKKLGEILEKMGVVSAEVVHYTLARKLGIPYVKLDNFEIDPLALQEVPVDVARKFCAIPLFNYRNWLVVALEDPANLEVIDILSFMTKRHIEVAIASQADIESAIDRYYGVRNEAEIEEALGEMGSGLVTEEKIELFEVERLAREKPIVRLVNNIILDAIRRNASDIHVRPQEDTVELWNRIDGTLVLIRNFGKSLLATVVSRIKIICQMDIAERRLPQDGRSSIVSEGDVVDLRISVIPTVEGESVVIRILNTATGLRSIDQLGFVKRDLAVFQDSLHKSHGVFLVTGPTGCGKSTTLYSALQEVQKQNVNIVTVENPVEYHIAGIEQIQVGNVPGYTFARALRHILRHDPDVIMVGEIRDEETAKITIESALTGHLVLSTLHTNNAASAVTRLMEMGIEPYLITATLLGVLAQRLARRNCPHCIEEEEVEPAVRESLGVSEDELFYKGKGCDACNQTGFSGRIAVYELLQVTPKLRSNLVAGVSADKLHSIAVDEGMLPLTQNTLRHARQRTIPLSEVYRVRLE